MGTARPALLALVTLAIAGCGQQQATTTHATTPPTVLRAHPQAIEPSAGGPVQQIAAAPEPAPASASLAQPVSDAVIRQELAASGLSGNPSQSTLTPALLAISPVGAPAAVEAVINAGNQIARLPYIWGGGHGRYVDTGYDCSGSLSFVLAAAGLLSGTKTSGELMSWGQPGPGKWITVFAARGHTFMYVAGLRFDTVALAETGSRWSNRRADESNLSGFVARHPPGL